MSRDDETGIPVYPRLPVPSAKRDSDASLPRKTPGAGGLDKKFMIAIVGTLISGIILGFVLRPVLTTDSRIGELETEVADTAKAVDSQKTRADSLDKQLASSEKAKKAAEDKLSEATKAQKELATRLAEAEAKAKDAKTSQEKLQAAVDKSIGVVSANGEEITLRLVDSVLFKTLDDQLTPRGKQVLDKVALALREMPSKQIWVQGHTDDQPIVQPPAPKPPPQPKPKPGAKPAPPPPAPPVGPKFATNWELSAARALTVVHYLQDAAKVDPRRLAAVAFGQYRPISSSKTSNRRIEIVLYPKPIVKK
jgi:chemotaxis protein MotB